MTKYSSIMAQNLWDPINVVISLDILQFKDESFIAINDANCDDNDAIKDDSCFRLSNRSLILRNIFNEKSWCAEFVGIGFKGYEIQSMNLKLDSLA